MRYTESKDRSAEVLRAALAQMARHDAALNPLSFAVWYEVSAGINARLVQAIEEAQRSEPRLGDETIARLYRDHVCEVDEAAMHRSSTELQRVMSGMAESAARTGHQAGAFGEQLTGLSQAMSADDSSALTQLLSQAVTGTAEMKRSADALQQQVTASQHEIERLRDDLSRARDEALFDPLTKVFNRKGFDQRLDAMMARPPAAGRAHCLVMLDIDRFKAVNDGYGHVMGDRVLQAVAEVLRVSLTDATRSVARYGGEEFAIVLPNSRVDDALAQAEASCERVRAMKLRDRRTQSVVLTVTISAGVTAMQAGEDASSLIARADGALYAAKQAGRDRVVFA